MADTRVYVEYQHEPFVLQLDHIPLKDKETALKTAFLPFIRRMVILVYTNMRELIHDTLDRRIRALQHFQILSVFQLGRHSRGGGCSAECWSCRGGVRHGWRGGGRFDARCAPGFGARMAEVVWAALHGHAVLSSRLHCARAEGWDGE